MVLQLFTNLHKIHSHTLKTLASQVSTMMNKFFLGQ